MVNCKLCQGEVKIKPWYNKEKRKRRKDLKICTDCWFNKLKPRERYYIANRYQT